MMCDEEILSQPHYSYYTIRIDDISDNIAPKFVLFANKLFKYFVRFEQSKAQCLFKSEISVYSWKH